MSKSSRSVEGAVDVGGAFTKLPQALTRFALATGSPDVTVKISLSRELLMQAGGGEEDDRMFPKKTVFVADFC